MSTWGSVSVLKSTIILVWLSFLTQKYFSYFLKLWFWEKKFDKWLYLNLNKILLHLICVSFVYEILVSLTVCNDNLNYMWILYPHYLIICGSLTKTTGERLWIMTMLHGHYVWLCIIMVMHIWTSEAVDNMQFEISHLICQTILQSCTHTLRGNCGCSHMLCTRGCFCFVC